MAWSSEVAFFVSLYAMCSAGMLIINKLAVYHIGVPSFVTLCQFVATAGAVLSGSQLGMLQLDPHDWNKIKHFVLYVLAFSAGTWSNMKVLMVANVETVIVFRACTPIVVSFFDYLLYGRAPPSPRSLAAMLTILAGALSYVVNDREFQVQGLTAYTWVCVWFVLLVFQLCYGKHLVTGLGLASMWSSVLYTNALSCVPTSVIGLISGEYARLGSVVWTTNGLYWLVISCIVGTAISWAGFKCQSVVTAAAYTVVGVVNKMLTVLINVVIWDEHASSTGIASLVVCVLGGAVYQQAPLRKGYEPSKTAEMAALVKPDSATEMSSCNSSEDRLTRRSKDDLHDGRGAA